MRITGNDCDCEEGNRGDLCSDGTAAHRDYHSGPTLLRVTHQRRTRPRQCPGAAAALQLDKMESVGEAGWSAARPPCAISQSPVDLELFQNYKLRQTRETARASVVVPQ